MHHIEIPSSKQPHSFFLSSASNYYKILTSSSHTQNSVFCSSQIPRAFNHLSSVSCVSTEQGSSATVRKERSPPMPLSFKPRVAGRVQREAQPQSSGVFFKRLLKYNERGKFSNKRNQKSLRHFFFQRSQEIATVKSKEVQGFEHMVRQL